MSWYVDESKMEVVNNSKPWWTTTYGPGDEVPVSGIYRCLGCGKEDACNHPDPFPPQNHHQHTSSQGRIRWRLNVRAKTSGD
jgi:hypothetical protein